MQVVAPVMDLEALMKSWYYRAGEFVLDNPGPVIEFDPSALDVVSINETTSFDPVTGDGVINREITTAPIFRERNITINETYITEVIDVVNVQVNITVDVITNEPINSIDVSLEINNNGQPIEEPTTPAEPGNPGNGQPIEEPIAPVEPGNPGNGSEKPGNGNSQPGWVETVAMMVPEEQLA